MSRDINLDLIDADPEQPRKHFDSAQLAELAASMAENGLAVPILLRPVGDRFLIVHGERRWRAAQSLGWTSIPADVRELTPEAAGWLMLIENIQRADLTPIEEAEAYRQRLESGITQGRLGERIGKSQSYIAQKLRLLTLGAPTLHYVQSGEISEGHARQLLRLKAIYAERTDMPLPEFQAVDHPDLAEELPETEAWCILAIPLLRLIHPVEGPVTFDEFTEGGRVPMRHEPLRTVAKGCREFYRAGRKAGALPQWQVMAFWWASVAVLYEMTVDTLRKVLESWEITPDEHSREFMVRVPRT